MPPTNASSPLSSTAVGAPKSISSAVGMSMMLYRKKGASTFSMPRLRIRRLSSETVLEATVPKGILTILRIAR
jgi:hypothetical protein